MSLLVIIVLLSKTQQNLTLELGLKLYCKMLLRCRLLDRCFSCSIFSCSYWGCSVYGNLGPISGVHGYYLTLPKLYGFKSDPVCHRLNSFQFRDNFRHYSRAYCPFDFLNANSSPIPDAYFPKQLTAGEPSMTYTSSVTIFQVRSYDNLLRCKCYVYIMCTPNVFLLCVVI